MKKQFKVYARNKAEQQALINIREVYLRNSKAPSIERNVLVVGDVHAPFDLDGYLEHCKEVYERFKCNQVVFIGDIIDNHYSSYHESETSAKGGEEELQLAIDKIAKWYEAFPKAVVIIGNHDRLIMRKAKSGNIPKTWIKDFKEVLNTPKWEFMEEFEQDDVVYIHGEGGTARTKMKSELKSVVQGHIHTQAYVDWNFGNNHRIFGMQVGCGIDRHSYGMAYARAYKKPAISCGVVLNNGTLPIVVPMNL